ncbi:MAG: ADP-ribosylglycohydrolase family protein [Candidatus Omnitrophota bacterium]
MIGAIAGDIIGSIYEFTNVKRTDFDLFSKHSHFTDDTVLTIAVADCILNGKDYAKTIKEYGRRYPDRGYGIRFKGWLLLEESAPYNSFGNGSAMRVSPVGFAFDDINKVMEEAKKSAEVTHNHPEGIKGAQAIAIAIFLAKNGERKENIKEHIENTFNYNLRQTLEEIRSSYHFDETCQGTVPQAITAFLESNSYEDAIRKAISIGGDSDTIACITGGIAEAYYKNIPDYIARESMKRLSPELLNTVNLFTKTYNFSKVSLLNRWG